MKIDIYCDSGSAIGVTSLDIYGKGTKIGIGGAELALLTMAEGWLKVGYEVRIFNNPRASVKTLIPQFHQNQFSPTEDRDVLIVFRVPSRRCIGAKGLKVWWSCDQYTTGDYAEYAPYMDRIVVISPFHQEYFRDKYSIRNTIVTDLPVRTWDYDNQAFPKIKNRMIFTSVPERGLGIVAKTWLTIKRDIPDASLVITSDYRLWGVNDPLNAEYRRAFIGYPGVQFLGAVKRDRLIQEQLQAEMHIYPCVYDELFCISVAESLVAGVHPVTSDTGALRTTNLPELIVEGNPKSTEWQEKFVRKIVEVSKGDKDSGAIKQQAIQRFGVETIVKYWEDNILK